MLRTGSLAVAMLVSAAFLPAAADDTPMVITLKDHMFDPAEVHVPANKAFVLAIDNLDATPEEFESHELKVEKVIPGGSSGLVRIGPLEPGEYPFYGEFNEATAQGKVIAE